MIEIYVRSFGRTYSARATVDGKTYKATAVVQASNKLAAMLKKRGIPDQPIKLIMMVGPDNSSFLNYPSLYKWATFDYLKERHRLGEEKMKEKLQVSRISSTEGRANEL